jgi:carbon starvation protein
VPAAMKHFWFNSGLSVVLMWVLAYSNAFNALWPIFGTANQLLAAMALLTVSAWLLLRKRRNWFTLVPAAFMVVTTLASLVILLVGYAKKANYILMAADLLLLALSAGVVALALKTFLRRDRILPVT